jgi:hypothetical protein
MHHPPGWLPSTHNLTRALSDPELLAAQLGTSGVNMVLLVPATMIFLYLHSNWIFDCACIFGVFDEDISSRADGISPPVSLMAPRLLKSLLPTLVLQKMVLPFLCHQFRSRIASWLFL